MVPLWSRQDIESRILAGETLVVRHGQVLRIPHTWLAAHPGGTLAILHFVGRDASDEMDAYHSDETFQRMNNFVVARVDQPWEALLPPVMSGWVRKPDPEGKQAWFKEADAVGPSSDIPRSEVLLLKSEDKHSIAPSASSIHPPPTTLSMAAQQQHVVAYRALHDQIKQAGLYDTPFITGYGPEVLRYVLLGAISATAYSRSWFITSAFFLGLLWHQLTFAAHDLGHCGVTQTWFWDRLIAIVMANFLSGLSIGWWVDNHNIHHLVTNHPSHDPDIQYIPFFAISPAFFNNLWSSYYKRTIRFGGFAALILSCQHRLFYIIMSLARFSLYVNSYNFLMKQSLIGRRAWHWYTEVAAVVIYWLWYTRLLVGVGSWKIALAYVLVSHVVPSPVHVQGVLSHFSRSTADLGPHESFPHRQLRTTTDVSCPPSLAFIHGGLHLQVTHHLFPRLPRHNLLAASKLVRAYAAEQGLEYAEFGFVKGNEEVRGVLKEVARQVNIVRMVADAEVKEVIKGSL